MPHRSLAAGCLAALALTGVPATGGEPAEPPPPALPAGFEQILPRGRIASIDQPRFVPASEAEIDADAWVFGVRIDGQARAYDLNLLNRHEVVNDRFDELPVAAVW